MELFDFQQEAADRLFDSAMDYFSGEQDRIGGRPVPFVGQLKAVTGAGKTPILASLIGRLPSAVVLWTTKFGSVVSQTATNLAVNGKYHHLLGGNAEVIAFNEIQSYAKWNGILSATEGLTILVSTVAAWNSQERDDRLNVHRVSKDWGDKSRWNQLKEDRKRPLFVLYDEAHNTTSEQIELLDDLDPSSFFIASASPIKGRLQYYLSNLTDEDRRKRIVSVRTIDVVEAQLLKSTISLADYDSPVEEMIKDVVDKRAGLERRLRTLNSPLIPKAIYVVEHSNAREGEPRPIALWRLLTENFGILPKQIAICTDTKNLPKDAIRIQNVDELSDQYPHIIFNKKLQEGWDNPAVYVCYFDGRTDSATRIQQVIGRALRQPGAKHFQDEELNTAYFFVNCPNEALETIVDDLKEELRIYKDDTADIFEPFQFKEERKTLPKIPVKSQWVGKLSVPVVKLEISSEQRDQLITLVRRKTMGFDADDLASPGKALVNIVSVRTGQVEQQSRDLFEDMRIRCGDYLRNQIRSLSKSCSDAIPTDIFVGEKLDRLACYRSKALDYYREVAEEVVNHYENYAHLQEDPVDTEYIVDQHQPSGTITRDFTYAGHAQYGAGDFNNDEIDMARALDKFAEYVWIRNKDRVGYGIHLPIKSEGSAAFYPDFLWWVNQTVWAIDPTGRHLLKEKVRTKLLSVPAPLKIALVRRGKIDEGFREVSADGWSLLRLRMGNARPEPFDTLSALLQALVDES